MKIKCKLDKTQVVMTEKGEKYSFSYTPTQEEFKDKVALSVKAEDPYNVLGKLNLPQSLGDIIILEITTKQTQSNLDEPKKKEK